jgi:hypothetical protein
MPLALISIYKRSRFNPNPPGGGHIVLTQIAQQIIKYKKIEKNTYS